MKLNLFKGIILAVAVHATVLLFGGLLFINRNPDHGSLQQVELVSEQDIAVEKKQEELKEKADKIESETEKPPDSAELIRNIEQQPNPAPALEAASLNSIEAALNGASSGDGDFAQALSFSSGGRIGGTGKAGAGNDPLENAFSLGEIDQKPRAIFQTSPVFPAGMKSVVGVVTLIFVVDETGKVLNPRVEKSSNLAFEKPAVDAVKQWKFEPAVKGGKRVACKMRVPIRFQAT